MSLGPTVLRPTTIPMLSVVNTVIAIGFGLLALFLDGAARFASVAVAIGFVIGAVWILFQARRSSVLIDVNQFIVKDGGRQRRFEIAQIESVDLRRLRGHIRFKDGSSVALPLEGRDLMEAGLLLTPRPADI